MDKSRRSFFGLGAAVVAMAAASRVKPAAAAQPAPSALPIGTLMPFLSHYENANSFHSHSGMGAISNTNHTHAYSSAQMANPHTHSFVSYGAVPVVKYKQWDGKTWVDLS
jgi:hypothetical protein